MAIGHGRSSSEIDGFTYQFGLFERAATPSPLEQHIVVMTANVENRCDYCSAGHSCLMKFAGMHEDEIAALCEDQPLRDETLDALRGFSRALTAMGCRTAARKIRPAVRNTARRHGARLSITPVA